MIGRAMLRWPASARLLSASLPTRSPKHTLVLSIRTYATPGRPKGVVGEPTRPVKRAVKRDAKKPADGTSIAERRVASRNKRVNVRAMTEEQKAAQLEKLVAARAAMKARKDKANVSLQKRKEKERVAELKKAALDIEFPKKLGPYTVFTSEQLKGQAVTHPAGAGKSPRLGELMKETAAKWKTLGPSEIEHYNVLARQNREASEAAYKRVVESYTPEEIRLANVARKQLNSKFPRKKAKGAQTYKLIEDERIVAKPVSAYVHFVINRQSTGDFNNISAAERLKLIAKEWHALNAEEKSKYQDIAKQDSARYAEQYKETYGHELPPKSPKAATAAA